MTNAKFSRQTDPKTPTCQQMQDLVNRQRAETLKTQEICIIFNPPKQDKPKSCFPIASTQQMSFLEKHIGWFKTLLRLPIRYTKFLKKTNIFLKKIP